MTQKQKRAQKTVNILKERYPQAVCSLETRSPFELLVSVRLSAQCTDKRVNTVTPTLFARYPDAAALAKADVRDVAEIIRPCGLAHTKARDLVGMAQALTERFNGEIPSTMEDLLTLPGVGRKSANLIMGDVFHMPGAVVADTHCIRLANRLELCDSTDPKQVERQLRVLLPPEESGDFCHRAVLFGREICTARSPHCGECPLNAFCPFPK